MSEFIEINGDIFNVDQIQTLTRTNEKNRLGKDSGVYILTILMERGIGSMAKAYTSKKERDEDFQLARTQLMEKRSLMKGYSCK